MLIRSSVVSLFPGASMRLSLSLSRFLAVLAAPAPSASRRSPAPAAARAVPSAPGRQPNLILLLMDDLDLSGIEHMPTLRTLFSQQGTTFTNAFVTTSVCCPSRASFLTGQYVHN